MGLWDCVAGFARESGATNRGFPPSPRLLTLSRQRGYFGQEGGQGRRPKPHSVPLVPGVSCARAGAADGLRFRSNGQRI